MRLLIVWVFLIGCAPDKPEVKNRDHDDSAVVVEVENEMITLREYDRRTQNYPKIASQNFQTVDQKRANLEYVAQFEAVAQYGIQQGYGTDPRAVLAAQERIVENVEQGKFEPTPEQIESETLARLQRSAKPEQRRISRFTNENPSLCDQLEEVLQNAGTTAEKFDAFEAFSKSNGLPNGNLGMKTKAELNAIGLENVWNAKVGAFGRNAPCDVWLLSGRQPEQLPDRAEIETAVVEELRKELRDAHRRSPHSP